MTSPVDRVAEDYLERYIQLDPTAAPFIADSRHAPAHLTDYGPDGAAARAAAAEQVLADLSAITIEEDDRVTAGAIRERLGVEIDAFHSGEWMRRAGWDAPPGVIQMSLRALPRSTADDWERLAARLADVPRSLASYRSALEAGVAAGTPALRRAVLGSAQRASAVAASEQFSACAAQAPEPLRERVERAGLAAEAAYGELARWLEHGLAPRADPRDGVGRERYALASRYWNGLDLDPEYTYEWAADELRRLREEMALAAHAVLPEGNVAEAAAFLDNDPFRCAQGTEGLLGWAQELIDSAIARLHGTYFDIPAGIQTVEMLAAPPGAASSASYSPPSADLDRPGRVWWPSRGDGQVPLWTQVTTAYHEGVPGHHLQIGHATWLGKELNAFQRVLGQVPGHMEGWACYAERLMDELGYLEDPGYRLGMLMGEARAAARVIIDIGLHLGLKVPDGEEHAGEAWTWEVAVPSLAAFLQRPEAAIQSEVERQLGMPAQAITYSVGEREWLRIREAVRRNEGSAFELKRFHTRALSLGFVGLAQLESELAG